MQITINLEGGKTKAAEEITVTAPSIGLTTAGSKAKIDSLAEIVCAVISTGVLLIIAIKPINMAVKGYVHQQPSTSKASSSQSTTSSTGFILPVAKNHCVTSEFNPARRNPVTGVVRPHNGIDLGDAQGTPILVVKDGTVTSARTNGGYGNQIVVDHGGGLSTSYSHLSKMSVGKGQQVKQGEVIGLMGSTGNSTGPHLHLEIKQEGVAKNPRDYIQLKRLREGC